MKLDPEGIREQEPRSNHGQEQGEQGWDLQSPGRGERGTICIGFNRAKTWCKLGGRKTGLAIAGVGQEWGSPVARACSGLATTAGKG